MFPRVTFILGGAASGKSAFAEILVKKSGKAKTYIATSHFVDDEMQARIARHKARRGSDWAEIEAPLDLAGALGAMPPGAVCLVDCATMWLANHLLADADLEAEQDRLLRAVAACRADLVIVSNEVGQGIVPGDALSRNFREAQGRLNAALAAASDTAVLVAAGLPLLLKGNLP